MWLKHAVKVGAHTNLANFIILVGISPLTDLESFRFFITLSVSEFVTGESSNLSTPCLFSRIFKILGWSENLAMAELIFSEISPLTEFHRGTSNRSVTV